MCCLLQIPGYGGLPERHLRQAFLPYVNPVMTSLKVASLQVLGTCSDIYQNALDSCSTSQTLRHPCARPQDWRAEVRGWPETINRFSIDWSYSISSLIQLIFSWCSPCPSYWAYRKKKKSTSPGIWTIWKLTRLVCKYFQNSSKKNVVSSIMKLILKCEKQTPRTPNASLITQLCEFYVFVACWFVYMCIFPITHAWDNCFIH